MTKMLNYTAVREMCEQRRLLVKELCNAVGITLQGLTFSLNHQTLPCDKTERLCRCLGITPNYFFGWDDDRRIEENNTQFGVNNNQNINTQSIEVLHEQLQTKDSQIAELLQIIQNK